MASIEAKIVDGHIEANLDGNGEELITLFGYILTQIAH